MPESGAAVRALDQTGDVGDDQRAPVVVGRDDAEVRDERRERVVGDLRLGRRDRGDQRGLAGVRKADDRHVGQELELDRETPLLARKARLGEPRGLSRRCGEVLVAPAAVSAADQEHALARGDEVGELLAAVGVRHDRAERQVDLDVLARLAVAVRAHAVLAALGAEAVLVPQVVESVVGGVGDRPDGSAVAAVAAGGAAARDELLAAKSDAAVAAVARLDVDLGGVDEHRWEDAEAGLVTAASGRPAAPARRG